MSTGQVKWFNNAKGFGFILPDDGGSDLFAHYSSIGMEGYKTLKAGQQVSFNIVEGPKGLHAANIMATDEADTDTTQQLQESGEAETNTEANSEEINEPSESANQAAESDSDNDSEIAVEDSSEINDTSLEEAASDAEGNADSEEADKNS